VIPVRFYPRQSGLQFAQSAFRTIQLERARKQVLRSLRSHQDDSDAYTATVKAAVIPFVTSPVTVASSSDAPSLNTMSDASVICA
jgi:hypothetical protein